MRDLRVPLFLSAPARRAAVISGRWFPGPDRASSGTARCRGRAHRQNSQDL